jgi:Flp pilus assembly protein TadD
MRGRIYIPVLAASALWAGTAWCGQQGTVAKGQTVRHHKEAVAQSSPEVDQAEAALEKKDYKTAESLLARAVEAKPDDFRAWFDLGTLYNETGRTPQAIDAYRKSADLKPDLFEPQLMAGVLLARSQDPAQKASAEKYLRAAIQMKPPRRAEEAHSLAWLGLGQALANTRPQDAAEAYAKAAELQPKDPQPHLWAASF